MDTKMNKYKLKHLAKFCCKPQNETEFEAVKMAAESGGVIFDSLDFDLMGKEYYIFFNEETQRIESVLYWRAEELGIKKISFIDFIRKLRMTEEEAMELEDDRVEIIGFDTYRWGYKDKFTLIPKNGHYFRVSEDGLTVTLHKNKQ